jgi:hypothetical protein
VFSRGALSMVDSVKPMEPTIMTKRFVATTLLGLGLLLSASRAHATQTTYAFTGVSCTTMPNADATPSGTAVYTQFGVHNSSGSNKLTVGCSLSFTSQQLFTQLDMTVYDRNPNSDISCTLNGVDTNGNVVAGFPITRNSSGSGAASMPLSFTGQSSQLFGANLICVIPPASLGNLSHIATYRLKTTF